MKESTVTAVVEKLPASKVKEISMMLSTDENKGKNMMLVEGPDDKTFYAYYVSEGNVVFNVLKGCYYMPTILELVNKDATMRDRVIGIKDADFDRVTGKKHTIPNLFLTDTHDWETMTLTEESEHNIAIEALNRSEKGMFNKVMNDLMMYSYLKLYNQVEICEKSLAGISFEDFSLSKIYDGNSPCQTEDCLREVSSHNNNSRHAHFPKSADIDRIKASFPTPDLYQFTCGHDVINGVVRRLIHCKGSSTDVGEKEVSRILRTSFRKEIFEQTQLYKAVASWAETHKTVVWVA